MHGRGDRARNLGLHVEDVRCCQVAIIRVRPQVLVRSRIDELCVDTYPVTRALEDQEIKKTRVWRL